MVDLAHCNPVGDDRLTPIGVSQHMRRIQQPNVAESTNRTAILVREQNPLSEHPLVESLLHHSLGVASNQGGVVELQITSKLKRLVVESDDELLSVRFLVCQVHGIDR